MKIFLPRFESATHSAFSMKSTPWRKITVGVNFIWEIGIVWKSIFFFICLEFYRWLSGRRSFNLMFFNLFTVFENLLMKNFGTWCRYEMENTCLGLETELWFSDSRTYLEFRWKYLARNFWLQKKLIFFKILLPI